MKFFTRLAVCIAASSMLFAGCSGDDGRDGKDGADATTTVNVASMTTDDWAALAPQAEVTSVTINSPPVVKFKLTDAKGNPVVGLGNNTSKKATDTVASYPNISFALAKLVPGTNGAPSKWVSYIVTTVPTTTTAATGSRPTTDNTGTLKDNGDGTYEYTFYRDITKIKDQVAAMTFTAPNSAADLGDLTYDPKLTHRLTIQVSGAARGTGTNTADGSNSGVTSVNIAEPANIIYDFIPATGKPVTTADAQREITLTAQCNECHSRFAIHGSNRVEMRYCVVCHTDQRKFGYAEVDGANINTRKLNNFAVGDFPNMIHKYHMGKELGKTYTGTYAFSEVGYPQDVRNCTKCHTKSDKAPQGDNWNAVASRMACGACHDGINWATGAGHIGGSASSDANCTLCHAADAVKAKHARTGSSLTFEITDAAIVSGKAVVKFKFNLDGITQLIPFTTQTKTTANVGYNGASATFYPVGSLVAGYGPETRNTRGAAQYPTIRVDYAQAQDGIANPDDFNANVSARLDQLWDGSAGTLTYDSASGVYTATITAAPVFPATGTKMATAKIVGYGTFTKSGDPNGGIQFQNVSKAITSTGFTARRSIVSNNACNACHEKMASKPNFHSGMRNDAPTCSGCHTPNLENSGWSVNASTFVHAIHGDSKRSVDYRWEDINWSELGYPGKLNKCEQCHVAGSYDFANAANSAAALSGRLLYSTAASGTVGAANINRPQNTKGKTIDDVGADLYLDPTAAYGPEGGLLDTGKTNLVHSPISAACFSCHDTASARAHMEQNGGSIYAVRSAAITKVEACLACHGSGKVGDIKAVHAR